MHFWYSHNNVLPNWFIIYFFLFFCVVVGGVNFLKLTEPIFFWKNINLSSFGQHVPKAMQKGRFSRYQLLFH